MLLEWEAMPPAHPSEIPGPCCVRARSKLSLGLFHLGTNPLAFPAWPCAVPCKRTKGSFHQPAPVGTPPGCGGSMAITHPPQSISIYREKVLAGCLSLPGAPTALGAGCVLLWMR